MKEGITLEKRYYFDTGLGYESVILTYRKDELTHIHIRDRTGDTVYFSDLNSLINLIGTLEKAKAFMFGNED